MFLFSQVSVPTTISGLIESNNTPSSSVLFLILWKFITTSDISLCFCGGLGGVGLWGRVGVEEVICLGWKGWGL